MGRLFAFVARLLFLRFLARHAKSLLPLLLSRTTLKGAPLKLVLKWLERYLKRSR